MSAVPVAMFSAPKIHEHLKANMDEKTPEEEPDKSYHSVFGMGSILPNYNSKLMNSIWGQYNLYASHAFQKNNEGSYRSATLLFNFPQIKNLWDIIHAPH